MSEHSLTEHSFAYYGNRVVRPPADPRRDTIRRSLSWALVALVHLLFLAMLSISFIQQERIGRKGAIETLLDLTLLHTQNAPPVVLIKPEVQDAKEPEINSAPITIPPVKPVPPEQTPPAAATPGDVLKSVGQELACGASNFENLTDRQRAKCVHQPWIARKLPNGTIVMDMPPKPVEPPEIHMSGAEAQRHEMQTAPGCPIMLQTPCVDDILNGRNSKPF